MLQNNTNYWFLPIVLFNSSGLEYKTTPVISK